MNRKNDYTNHLQIWLEPETPSIENWNEQPTITHALLPIQLIALNDVSAIEKITCIS